MVHKENFGRYKFTLQSSLLVLKVMVTHIYSVTLIFDPDSHGHLESHMPLRLYTPKKWKIWPYSRINIVYCDNTLTFDKRVFVVKFCVVFKSHYWQW